MTSHTYRGRKKKHEGGHFALLGTGDLELDGVHVVLLVEGYFPPRIHLIVKIT